MPEDVTDATTTATTPEDVPTDATQMMPTDHYLVDALEVHLELAKLKDQPCVDTPATESKLSTPLLRAREPGCCFAGMLASHGMEWGDAAGDWTTKASRTTEVE